jgi:predicted cupin superfamily sugar epimerase
MNPQASELIKLLDLEPLRDLEGGYFREVVCTSHLVQPSDSQRDRGALTTIHFSLVAYGHDPRHRVT